MKSRLRVLRGPDRGAEFPLDDGQEVVIGRGPDCTVQLNDPTASRIHCRIAVKGGQATLYDADSRWGTLVNGQFTGCRELEPGDRITVGETELQLAVETSPDATTLARPIAERDVTVPPGQRHGQEVGHDDAEGSPKPSGAEDSPGFGAPPPGDVVRAVGTRFAGLDVESVVARARTGVVFRAADAVKQRAVALKVFYPESFQDARGVRRFLRAVRTMLPIEHENLVALYDAGENEGLCYTASEFVEGESAAELIQRIGISGMLEWQYAFRMAVDVARGLEEAGRHGIIHRNVTPRNILIRSDDRLAKLGDLVLAKAMEESGEERITRPGEMVGQLEYLAPEQTTGGRPPDARSDVYSLGATLYAVLTGRPPFEGRTPVETILEIQTEEPAKPTKYHLSIAPLFEDVVLRMLAKRPDDRYRSPGDLLKDLKRVAKYHGLSWGRD